MERSHLTNGRFLHTLDGWTAAGGAVYAAGMGDAHYGVASLPAGASIAQQFVVPRARQYTLAIAVRGASATVTITDGDGATVVSDTASGLAGEWTESTIVLGLAPGTTYTLTLANAGGTTLQLDDLWLWAVPVTRAQLAARVHRKLGALASDGGLTTTPSAGQSEGSYTDPIDAGLRAIGALNDETGEPDLRAVDAGQVDRLLDAIEREALEQLQRSYAVLTDIRVGERDEKLSQIGAAIARLSGAAASGGGGKVIARTLRREAADYELG